jgi:hypothetical protein
MTKTTVGTPPLWIQCGKCKRPTRHETLGVYDDVGCDDEAGIEFGESFRIVKCLGCATASFQHESWNDGTYDEDFAPVVVETLYPSRTEGRAAAIAARHLPTKVRAVYAETLRAYNAEVRLLTAVGLRALVESICIEASCEGGNLVSKIADLVAKGAIAERQATFLDVHRVVGNDAVHEMTAPPLDELTAALDIIESVMMIPPL